MVEVYIYYVTSLKMSFYGLQSSNVSGEKTATIHIIIPVEVMCLVSLTTSKI